MRKRFKNKQTRRRKGGRVIASGSYGCVFHPALRCHSKKTRSKHKITKLMMRKDAKDEYELSQKILRRIKHIKNYKNYFMVDDFSLCTPGKLSRKDLEEFDERCDALTREYITKQNINEPKSLDKILALNMPNGGVSIDKYLREYHSDDDCIELNNKLIDLLVNGIVKMNANHIYHCDLKYDNILVERDNSTNTVYTRLIDWGLSTEYVPFKHHEFMSAWGDRPILFNQPFSVVLFSDKFKALYQKYIESGKKVEADALKPFVLNYVQLVTREHGSRQLQYVKKIMYMLFIPSYEKGNYHQKSQEKKVDDEITTPYIVNYIVQVLLKFTKLKEDGTIDLQFYLDNLFIKIVDIYGFVLSYIVIYEMIQTKQSTFGTHTKKEKNILNFIKALFIKYLFEPCVEEININELVENLSELNHLFQNPDIN
jgi:serine/threonine protein kinase